MSRLTCLRDDFGPVGKFDRVYNECRRLIIELELGAREKHGAEVLEGWRGETVRSLEPNRGTIDNGRYQANLKQPPLVKRPPVVFRTFRLAPANPAHRNEMGRIVTDFPVVRITAPVAKVQRSKLLLQGAETCA